MTYVIGSLCIDVTDRACMDVCPVDCIHEGSRKLYIDPETCIDCGACEPVCPNDAVFHADDALDIEQPWIADNAQFFAHGLQGSGTDTPLVQSQ